MTTGLDDSLKVRSAVSRIEAAIAKAGLQAPTTPLLEGNGLEDHACLVVHLASLTQFARQNRVDIHEDLRPHRAEYHAQQPSYRHH